MTTPCSQQLHFGCLEESNYSCQNCMLKWYNREMSMTHVIEAEDFSECSVFIYTEKIMSCCFTWRIMNVLYIGAGGLKICPNRVQNRICTFWVSPLPQQLHWTKQFQYQTAKQLQKFTVVGYGNLGFSQRFKHLGAGIELIKPLPFCSNGQLGWNPHPWHSRPRTLVPYLLIKSHLHTSGSATSPNAHFRKLLMVVTNTSSKRIYRQNSEATPSNTSLSKKQFSSWVSLKWSWGLGLHLLLWRKKLLEQKYAVHIQNRRGPTTCIPLCSRQSGVEGCHHHLHTMQQSLHYYIPSGPLGPCLCSGVPKEETKQDFPRKEQNLTWT